MYIWDRRIRMNLSVPYKELSIAGKILCNAELSKDILNAFSKNGNTRPQAGEWVKLGRVKTERLKDGYKIKTRKVTFDLKKASNGAYQSQDGTYWQLVPKGVENKQ